MNAIGGINVTTQGVGHVANPFTEQDEQCARNAGLVALADKIRAHLAMQK